MSTLGGPEVTGSESLNSEHTQRDAESKRGGKKARIHHMYF